MLTGPLYIAQVSMHKCALCMLCLYCSIFKVDKFAYYLVVDVTNSAESDTEAGTVRLAAGSRPHEGRVEVAFASIWGTVCGHDWDLQDALVVCRQLGYYTALNATSGIFGEGTGPIWLDDTNCSGNETNLSQCSSIHRLAFSCSHSEDAGVICAGV